MPLELEPASIFATIPPNVHLNRASLQAITMPSVSSSINLVKPTMSEISIASLVDTRPAKKL